MGCVEDDDETQVPGFAVDTHRGKWMKEDAMVDCGAMECVTCRQCAIQS